MMTQQWTVWCEKCSAMEQISGSKKFVTSEVKMIGWTNKKKWLCPICSRDSKTETETENENETEKRINC